MPHCWRVQPSMSQHTGLELIDIYKKQEGRALLLASGQFVSKVSSVPEEDKKRVVEGLLMPQMLKLKLLASSSLLLESISVSSQHL